jgi:hypothetical protein
LKEKLKVAMVYLVPTALALLQLVGQAFTHVTVPEDFRLISSEKSELASGNSNLEGVNACKIRAPPGVYLSLGFGSNAGMAPSKPELKAGMTFVDFPNVKATESAKTAYEALVPEAIRWFNVSSYGRLKFSVKEDPSFYTMPNPSKTYSMGRGLTAQAHGAYIP